MKTKSSQRLQSTGEHSSIEQLQFRGISAGVEQSRKCYGNTGTPNSGWEVQEVSQLSNVQADITEPSRERENMVHTGTYKYITANGREVPRASSGKVVYYYYQGILYFLLKFL